MALIFWLAAGLVAFHYVGYPLLFGVLAKLKQARPLPPQGEIPPVTMIISVYNEEDVILERLENCKTLDYPGDKLKILVVSDGSTDATHGIVESFQADNPNLDIQLKVVSGRVGKTGALNAVIPTLTTEIVVFTDANSMLLPDALKRLVPYFSNPKVGAVCGELSFTDEAGNPSPGAENAYWKYEKFIKKAESRVSTLTVYNGALYALRRQLHRPMNPQAANDFQHPLQVAIQGFRAVYEPLAIATEPPGNDEAVEARRRVRIISRGWKGMVSHIQVLNPFKTGIFTFQLIGRKLLRWLGPVLMLTALISNIFLVTLPIYQLLLLLQVGFYALAVTGAMLNRLNIKFKLAYYPFYFCLINWAALQALFRFAAGRDSAVWTPTTHASTGKE